MRVSRKLIGLVVDFNRFRKFYAGVSAHTELQFLAVLLVAMCAAFSALLFAVERGVPGTPAGSFGDAIYWSVTAFTTAGLSDAPVTSLGKLVGGIWIVLGSILFFGTIVGVITAWFMRPLQRPGDQIIDTIQDNLERLDELSLAELELLRDTVNTLIGHMERLHTTREAAAFPRD